MLSESLLNRLLSQRVKKGILNWIIIIIIKLKLNTYHSLIQLKYYKTMIFSRIVLSLFCDKEWDVTWSLFHLRILYSYFKKMEQFQFARHSNKNYINVQQEEASARFHVGLFVQNVFNTNLSVTQTL